uniref:C-type lectin domain-containing protein n=1 Tax=Mastacembelus armatus TaxID=205130 RepID=A0A3Q3LA10_9TELE
MQPFLENLLSRDLHNVPKDTNTEKVRADNMKSQLNLSLGITRQYYYVNLLKTWADAQSYCRQNSTELASITTEEEWESVKQIMGSPGKTNAWIGLYDDIREWRWSLDNTYLYENGNTTLEGWITYKFDSYESEELCVELHDYKLNDGQCNSAKMSVCYDGKTAHFNSIFHFYKYIN